MNIQNIQLIQGQLIAAGVKSGSGKGKSSAESSASLPEPTLPESHVQTAPGSKATDINYPPLFPIGHTQGIYASLPESGGPSSGDTVKPKKEGAPEDKTAHKEEIARQQSAYGQGGAVQNKGAADKNATSPGSILDLAI